MRRSKKVILIQNIENLGKKNEIKEVSESYAENFLIPEKKAFSLESSEGSEYFKNYKKKEDLKVSEKQEEFKKISEILDKTEMIFFLKKDKNEKIFGSIKKSDLIKLTNEIFKKNFLDLKLKKENFPSFEEIRKEGSYKLTLKIRNFSKLFEIKVTLKKT